MDAMPKPTMQSSVLRAVLRTWRVLKNATMAFFNRLLSGAGIPTCRWLA
jgi:hypothetical protein